MEQLDLLSAGSQRPWPEQADFPANQARENVGRVVFEDLLQSNGPLVITGYASLDKLVELLARLGKRESAPGRVRILLGHEPYDRKPISSRPDQFRFSQEVVDYWLERGVSLHQCAQVFAAMEMLRSGTVEARITASSSAVIHAKIYRGDNAVTIGSSNFSNAGLQYQIEANCRYRRELDPERFAAACDLAEKIWALGCNYTDELLDLLGKLLRAVSWHEALARASAELLEGEWVTRYLKDAGDFSERITLWPSQIQGVAQALWIVSNVGSVLVADATGSGKTRTGCMLVRGIMNQLWATGKIRRSVPPLLTCPASVQDDWRAELHALGQYSCRVHSHGLLGKVTKKGGELADLLTQAQVLMVDEAHNFLNRRSGRTRGLWGNLADHVVLLTATPLNRKLGDLLAIVDLLGADNFEDDALAVLSRLWKKQGAERTLLFERERPLLQAAIQKFTVRRTKDTLNRMIDREPENYRDRFGRMCRYPKHSPLGYDCNQMLTGTDKELVRSIRSILSELKGLLWLQGTFTLSGYHRALGWDEEKYLAIRLTGAPALAVHNALASLRSSRPALLEHLFGSRAVEAEYGLGEVKKGPSGNILEKLLAATGKPPQNLLKGVELPPWLSDPGEYERACTREIALYRQVADLVRRMSPAREDCKASLLKELLGRHDLVLAFDSHLVSLYHIRQRIGLLGANRVVVATGVDESGQNEVRELLRLGSKQREVIALCSDAMSEAISLQASSAVVHLDMPTTMRYAEQRVGRIDRMDSPHESIDVYWPLETGELSQRKDERFLVRHRLVSDLFGSNVPLPEDWTLSSSTGDEGTSLEEVLSDLKDSEAKEGGGELADAFDPVRALIEGNRALVPPATYEAHRTSKARVISSVGVVETAAKPWAFFTVAAAGKGVPRWVFFEHSSAEPMTDLEQIARSLRERLTPDTVDLPFEGNAAAVATLELFLMRLQGTEHFLLPRKKRKALTEMREVLKRYRRTVGAGESGRRILIDELLCLAREGGPGKEIDPESVADCWLAAVRPVWQMHLEHPKRAGPLVLKDIRNQLVKEPLPDVALKAAFSPLLENARGYIPVDRRVVVAIVGIESRTS